MSEKNHQIQPNINPTNKKKKVFIPYFEIEAAIEHNENEFESKYYFDISDGKFYEIPFEILGAAEECDPNNEDTLDEFLEDYDEELITKAFEITTDEVERFLEVPILSSRDSFNMMEEFAEGQENETLRNLLFKALNRPKPFRGFKDVFEEFNNKLDEWYSFKKIRNIEFANKWLEQINNSQTEIEFILKP